MREKWLEWAVRLQSIAQCGLTYSKDKYDIERFQQIRDLAADIMHDYTDIPLDRVKDLFCMEKGYQTPKVDVRGAIIEDGGILLVREQIDGKWSLPGGWAEVDLSLGENVVKEVREESGLDVEASRLLAVLDAGRRNPVPAPFGIYKIIVECISLGGSFRPNIETLECGFFKQDRLPELSQGRTTEEQIAVCFRAAGNAGFVPVFD